MGDYASTTRPEVFMEKSMTPSSGVGGSQRGGALYQYRGNRLRSALAESLIKQITGGDEVQVRFMRPGSLYLQTSV